MADTKISALTAKAVPVAADITNILDSAAANADKKILLGNIPLTGNIELKALATGILKSTTTTGALSIAGASDLPSAIDAAKIADGSVSNTEFQYLANVSSDVQGQLDDLDNAISALDPAVADHGYSGSSFTATAGENLAINEVCYLKSDGKYWKAKADATTTMPGVVMATAAINADATGVFLQKGFIRNDDGWGGALTVGSPALLYVSGATGGLATQTKPTTSGHQVQVIGYAYAARIVFFESNLVLVQVP